MESRQSDKPVDAILELAQQLERFKQVLAEIIQDSTLNKDGEYETVFVFEPSQTLARAYWNMLTRIKDFIVQMDNVFYPTKIKAGLIAQYINNLFKEIDDEFDCKYMLMASPPDPENLSKLPCKNKSAYIHVIDGEKQRLFYIHKGTCKELPSFKDTLFNTKGLKHNELYSLSEKHLELIEKEVSHQHLGRVVNENIYLIAKAAREFLDYYYDTTIAGYRAEKIKPLLEKAKKILPMSLILMVVKIFLPDFPEDFSMDTYLDEKNTGQIGIKVKKKDGKLVDERHPSLNVNIKDFYDRLEKCMIQYEKKRAELVCADAAPQHARLDSQAESSCSSSFEEMVTSPPNPIVIGEQEQEDEFDVSSKSLLELFIDGIVEKQKKLKENVRKLQGSFDEIKHSEFLAENKELDKKICELELLKDRDQTDVLELNQKLENLKKECKEIERSLIKIKTNKEAEEAQKAKDLREKQVMQWKDGLDIYLAQRNAKYKEVDNIKRATVNVVGFFNTGLAVIDLEIKFNPGYRQRREYIAELKIELDAYAKSGNAQPLTQKLIEGTKFKPRVKDTSPDYQQTLESLLCTISDALAVEEPSSKCKL